MKLDILSGYMSIEIWDFILIFFFFFVGRRVRIGNLLYGEFIIRSVIKIKIKFESLKWKIDRDFIFESTD